jgi:hypothetical protein
MCTTTLTYPRVIRFRGVLAIGLIAILILASLALIAGLILGVLSSTTRDGYQADQIPVVRKLVIPVPTPAVAEIQPVASQISTPSPVGPVERSVVPVPVPTPPL